jgi:hypothetical protein
VEHETLKVINIKPEYEQYNVQVTKTEKFNGFICVPKLEVTYRYKNNIYFGYIYDLNHYNKQTGFVVNTINDDECISLFLESSNTRNGSSMKGDFYFRDSTDYLVNCYFGKCTSNEFSIEFVVFIINLCVTILLAFLLVCMYKCCIVDTIHEERTI